MTTTAERPSHQVKVLQTVNARLPRWRSLSLPRRIRVAAWPERRIVVHGQEFGVSVLPGSGVQWFARGPRYWYRRVQIVVLMLVAAAVTVAFDVGFAESARETSMTALVWLTVVLAVLAAAALIFYWRPDLYAEHSVTGSTRLPGPLRVAGLVVGLLGLCLTPAWVLSFAADMLPRFPWQEHAAWARLANQQPDGWGEPSPSGVRPG